MPCRIGITTDLVARKAYWQNRVVGLKNWRIIGSHNTQSAAQAAEDRYALSHGCHSNPGGASAIGRWHVYHFDYTRDPGP